MAALHSSQDLHTSGSFKPEQIFQSFEVIPQPLFPMDPLDINVSLELDDKFSQYSQGVSSSASFSTPSSIFDSFSGRSTPKECRPTPIDFDFCNSSASIPYQLTPPSTASTACFPHLESGLESLEMQQVLPQHLQQQQIPCQYVEESPATPSRRGPLPIPSGNEMGLLDVSSGHQQAQIDICGFKSGRTIDPASFGRSTSTPPRQDGSTLDANSMWNFSVDSPILFGKQSSSSVSPMKSVKLESPGNGFSRSARRKLFIENAQKKSSALQRQVQRLSPNQRDFKDPSEFTDYDDATISFVPRSGYPCQFPGCDKKYKRQEHLKRHFHA